MAHLRLLADDLTGALDSAARFAAVDRPGCRHLAGCGRSRARSRSTAARASCPRKQLARASSASRRCWTAGRRHSRRSTACCAAMLRWNSPPACAGSIIVCWPRRSRSRAVSPATAANLRVTGDVWRDTGVDLPAELRALGVEAPNARCRNRRRPGCHRGRGAPSDRSGAVVRHRRAGGRARRTRHGAAPCPVAADPGADRQRPSGEPRTGRRGSGGPATGGRRVRPTGRDRPARPHASASARHSARCWTGSGGRARCS